MELVKAVVEILGFMCNSEFWRMGVLWTFSLIFSYLKLFYQTLFSQKSKCYPRCLLKDSIFAAASVAKPVCIITGATSGLGAAAAYALSKEGFYIVLVGRSSELLSKAISDIKSRNKDACLKAFEVNLTSFASILGFKHSLQQWLRDSNMHSSVQLFINNAGILAKTRRFTSQGYDEMLTTNYVGAFCLTKVLLPLLENSPVPSRVVNVTSFTHRNVRCGQADKDTVSGKSFMKSKDYPYARIYEYSKLCMLLFSYELHRKVSLIEKSQHLSIVAADPGAVQTNIMREIPWPISAMAFAAMRLLGVLQSSETGVSAIVDAALAPPVSTQHHSDLSRLCCVTFVSGPSRYATKINAGILKEASGVYFFGGKGRSLNSSALSYDAKLAKDLWDASCNLFEELRMAARRVGNCNDDTIISE